MVELTSEEKKALCKEVAVRLSDIRRLLHMSQARFGDVCGISRARIIQIENGSARLSWGQLTSVMFVCSANYRTKEYFYANNILGPRFLQYIQQKDENIPPDTNVCVREDIIMSFKELLEYNREYNKNQNKQD